MIGNDCIDSFYLDELECRKVQRCAGTRIDASEFNSLGFSDGLFLGNYAPSLVIDGKYEGYYNFAHAKNLGMDFLIDISKQSSARTGISSVEVYPRSAGSYERYEKMTVELTNHHTTLPGVPFVCLPADVYNTARVNQLASSNKPLIFVCNASVIATEIKIKINENSGMNIRLLHFSAKWF